MLVSDNIPNLTNGVSQQAPQLRLPSQGEVQVNMFPSLVEGLCNRPPTHFKKKISDVSLGEIYTTLINRDSSAQYLALFTSGGLKVFNLDGEEKSITYKNGTGYLADIAPIEDLKAMTVADYTFVLNKNKKIKMIPALTSTRGFEAIVFIKVPNYLTTYNITINGTTASYSTPSGVGTVDKPPSQISTTGIAGTLVGQLQGKLTNFTFVLKNSTLWIRKKDNTKFNISVSDSRGDTQMFLATDTVQHFSDLPTVAPNGFICKVAGDAELNHDDYYVEFVADNGSSFGQGVWVETAKEGIEDSFDASTMPYGLVHEADDSFTFKQLEWLSREVGDSLSCPAPSFVNTTLSDIFFHRNRLGFLSDDNVIMSRAGYFFNFWPETAMTVTDGDPIDYSASHEEVVKLKHAVSFQEELLFFADKHQFILDSGEVLSPSTAVVKHATSYDSNMSARPVPSGKTVFFCFNNKEHTGVREYLIETSTDTKDAADITAHVPEYIPQGIYKMCNSTDQDILVLLSKDIRNRLYLYKYYWSGSEKLQSAWFYYTFPEDAIIRNMEVLESTLHLIVEYSDGVYWETIDLAPKHIEYDTDFIPTLDRLVSEANCTVTYDADSNMTVWLLPYIHNEDNIVMLDRETMLPIQTIFTTGSNEVKARGNFTERHVYIGALYKGIYTFSEQFIRSGTDGNIAINQGRLQYTKWDFICSKSGPFKIALVPDIGPCHTYEYSPRLLGNIGNKIGKVVLGDDRFSVGVRSKSDRINISIIAEVPTPVAILSVEWEGNYYTRSRRV